MSYSTGELPQIYTRIDENGSRLNFLGTCRVVGGCGVELIVVGQI